MSHAFCRINIMGSPTSVAIVTAVHVLVGLLHHGTGQFCPSGSSPSPSAPPLPSMLYQSFQAHVEVNMLEVGSGKTVDVDQYLDYDGNNGLLIFFKDGVQFRSILSYNTNELFEIDSLSHCKVTNLSANREMFIFGDDVSDGFGHIPPASQALRFGSKYNPVFKGYATVRGMKTMHWQSCLYSSHTKFNFTLDHYFTTDTWSTSSTHVSVPVRIEMQGEQVYSNGSQPRTLHHVYDYFDFRADADVDSSVFNTPPNVECPGRISTVQLPQLPDNYYFRQEMIDIRNEVIMQADVWFNYDSRYLRLDHRPTSINPPINTLNPITEVHDFNYGVRYIKDQVTGNCSVFPLVNGSDSAMNTEAFKANHSFFLHMRDPLQFFRLNSDYTYSGQRLARNALCDVFTSVRSDFPVPGVPQVNTTFEYYFLSEGWSDDPNTGYSSYQTGFPFRLEITSLDNSYAMVYNFLDFDGNSPDLSVFDISDCFPDTGKLYFKVQFPAKHFSRDKENLMKTQTRLALMGAMDVNPIRIQRLNVEYDKSNVYVAAVLVDRTPSYPQFSYVPGSEMELKDDMVWNNITSPMTCADLCVSSEGINCRSFDYCSGDGYKCKLSKSHIGDGGVVLKKSVCDHFSRTVNPKDNHETDLSEAYDNLVQVIGSNQLQIQIAEDDGSTSYYSAIDTTITYGYTDTKPLPSMPEQFSYHIEIVYPGKKVANDGDIWYDSKYKLGRYDYRDIRAPPPFYSEYTMTYIHDYNTGIAYNIDQVKGNCTITPLTTTLAFDAEKDKSAYQNNGATVIQMKGPLDLLHLNYPYRYAGEKTVRGVKCDVFEADVPDYNIPLTNYTFPATFQYFFLSSSWNYVADPSTDVTQQQPIMARIVCEQANLFLVYNYYNFDDEDPLMSVYDINSCFHDKEKLKFEITFNQTYHPYLDTMEPLFKRELVQEMSDLTGASPLRFQNMDVTYDLNNIYVILTLLGHADFILYFTKLTGPHPAHHTSKTITNIASPSDCAQICMMEDSFVCNSFDICPSSQTCRLSRLHIDDSFQPAETGPDNQACTHYSRSVNGSAPEPDMMHVFDTLKDIIYKHALQLPIDYQDTVFTYMATGVRKDFVTSSRPAITEGEYLHQYIVYLGNVILNHNDKVITQVAVDDCATACSTQTAFDCQSFEYCYTSGVCMMSHLHPDQNQGLIRNHSFCDMYAKKYLQNYDKYPGEVLMTSADQTVDHVSNANMCAHTCSETTDFDCRSFDFCPSLNSCRLRKTHILDAPDTSVVASPMCDHYSRSFIHDFQKTGSSVIKGHDDIIITDVTKDDCAKLCVEEDGIECKSFEYCLNTTDCRISTAHPRSGKVSLVISDYCDLYTRALIKGTTPYDPNAAIHYRYLTKTPDDSGAKAGLAIGMLILGAVLAGGVIFIVYNLRFRKSKNYSVDTMAVHFAKDEADSS